MHSMSSLKIFPRISECKRDEIVLKLNSNAEWQLRRVVISKDRLLIGLTGHDAVTDEIPLVFKSKIIQAPSTDAD